MNRSVIVVAGGRGTRMGAALPKQFIPLGGKPILMHTLEAWQAYDANMQRIVVLPEEEIELWQDLCRTHQFTVAHRIVAGGSTRSRSVVNGLRLVDSPWVAVHDGVRPFVSRELLARCFDATTQHQAIVPVCPITDSLRRLLPSDHSTVSVSRSEYVAVQTPQVFETQTLLRAYAQPKADASDDATLVEQLGINVYTVAGDVRNMKITTPFDLAVAEIILARHNL